MLAAGRRPGGTIDATKTRIPEGCHYSKKPLVVFDSLLLEQAPQLVSRGPDAMAPFLGAHFVRDLSKWHALRGARTNGDEPRVFDPGLTLFHPSGVRETNGDNPGSATRG
jgi:hypothetical protein